ncbi:MAG TPA: hypothetical protein VGK20_02435 [Candidatus Binatia bacterium]|jgi:hypothetical protein
MDVSAVRPAAFLIIRFFIYAAIVALAFESIVTGARTHDLHWLMRDDGPVETAQLIAAFSTAAWFFVLSRRRPRYSLLFQFFSALSLIACARELDNVSLELGWRDGYVWVAMIPLAWALSVVVRGRERLFVQLATFSRSSSFALLLAGFLTVVVFAQIMGQKVLWLAVLDESIYRPIKELVEESSELLGYLLMLFGAAEAAADEPAD